MATVTGFTAARMQEIEDTTVVDGNVVGDNLILLQRDGTPIDAGSVRGPIGPTGGSILVRTSVTRPTGGDLFEGLGLYETDTKRFYIYDGTAWQYRGGTWICTSATRPASPFDGLEIYETDTKRRYVYNGTAWAYLIGGQDPTMASAHRTAAMTLATGTTAVLICNVENYDYGNCYNTTTGLYVCPTAGVYEVSGRYSVGTAASNERFAIGVAKNGGDYQRGADVSVGGVPYLGLTGHFLVPCAAGDTLALTALQILGTGRALEIATAPQTVYNAFRRVSQ